MPTPCFGCLNAPYAYPSRHWELDDAGQPTQKILEARRRAEFITPIPRPKKQKGAPKQETFLFDESAGLTSAALSYDHTAVINSVRQEVDRWRLEPDPNHWRVTPKTGRLLQPSDPDSYYASRELVPSDLLDKVKRPKIVITNTTPCGGANASRFPRVIACCSGAGAARPWIPRRHRGRCFSASCPT